MAKQPNVIFVFSDQHRRCDSGFAGNGAVHTPNLDAFAGDSVEFTRAVSGMPVCCPYRATLLTGQYPLTHGVFLNDAPLDCGGPYLAECFRDGGYRTAYVGKWHVDGHGRESFIPRERRRGFDYWQVLECTHDYNRSPYFGDTPERRFWDGYDAFAQTDCAIDWLRRQDAENPFLMVLSWGPPHNPLDSAPPEYQALYDAAALPLRPNVPPECADAARHDLAGYYAHISALDDAFGRLRRALAETGLERDTILIYTSDHGDMLFSQGLQRKQKPWEESIRVPFLLRWPAGLGEARREMAEVFNSPDIMPTLLGLCGLSIPDTVEGTDFAPFLRGEAPGFRSEDAILECVQPAGEFARGNAANGMGGGREYRGLRTKRYTYVRDRADCWLLYDDDTDPYQLRNLANDPAYADVRAALGRRLDERLAARGDEFLDGRECCARRGYILDETGTFPYHV